MHSVSQQKSPSVAQGLSTSKWVTHISDSRNTLLSSDGTLMQRLQRRAILGEDKTIRRLKERFNWPGYSDDVSGQRHVRINRGNEVWGFRMMYGVMLARVANTCLHV